MSDPMPPAPDKVVFPGETVGVPTKNPVTSYRWWGAVVAILSWALVVAVKKGWLPEEIRQPVQDLSLEVVAGMIGTIAALAGGWTATQPLGWTRTHVTKTVKLLAPLLLIPLFTGCVTRTGQPVSRAAQLHLARQTHTAAANVASSLIEQGVIKDQGTKDAIFYASREVLEGTDEAEARLGQQDWVGFDFIMARVQTALDRLASINARNKRSEAGPRSDAWTPPRSRPSFSWESRNFRSWPARGNALTAARSRPTTISRQSRQPRPQPTHV